MSATAEFLVSHIRNSAFKPNSVVPKSPIFAKELTTTILNQVRLGRIPKAVSILFSSEIPFSFTLYADLIQLCSSKKAIVEIRKLESHLLSFHPDPPVYLLNRTIESYGECGCVEDASALFDEMPVKNRGSWTSIISAYSKNGFSKDVLGLFRRMTKEGIFSTEGTFASVLASCGGVLESSLTRQVHALIVKYGFVGNVILESSLVHVYGKCKMMSDARRIFDEIQNPNSVSWNVIVRRYLEDDDGEEAVKMFFKMIRMKANPMSSTVSNAVLACTNFGGLQVGAQIHGYSVKVNFEDDEVIESTLLSMYAKCGDLESARLIFDLPFSKTIINYTSMVSAYGFVGRTKEARNLFDQMPERNIRSWNMMLGGYTRFLEWDKALELLIMMRRGTNDIDHVTLRLILNISAGIPDIELGKQVHGYVYRHCFNSNLSVDNAILDMYGKCGNIKSARVWFYTMSHLRDLISWNALLTTYSRHRLSEEAMFAFWNMLGETKPSKFTFSTILAACANINAIDIGKQSHAFMIRNEYDMDIVINGALVDMYSKCRCVVYAVHVFNKAEPKDLILCNSIILGCAHNGLGEKVVELFETMEKSGIKPNNVTFQGLLLACIEEGQVELGRKYFELMSEKYWLMPYMEHYESMIVLYGKHGLMDELEIFVKNMRFKPTAPLLTKVLEFSIEFKCKRLGEWAAEQLNELKALR